MPLRVTSSSFENGGPLPEVCAFGSFRGGRLRFGENRNPALAWSDLPGGTRSLAVICDDLDVPVGLDQGTWQRGDAGAASVRSLCHWVLVDLPPDGPPIGLGEFSDGVYAGGKPGPAAPRGAREGLNEFTDFFASSGILARDYHGYDGPCPPPGAAPHRYVFEVFALDAERLALPLRFTKAEALGAMSRHVLASARITGTAG